MSERGVTVINGNNKSRSVSPVNVKVAEEDDKEKKFQNGWTKEQERLMADWSDIAVCYRWLHDRSDKIFHIKTLWISLPVIFLSTISGFSNIGVQAILESEEAKKYASFAIAAISLFAGLLTTVGDRLRYAQFEESHRVAAIAWGKFQRLIAVELALNPDDRMDSLDFLKICRSDLDRLIEQSPPIPRESISLFEKKFGKIKDLKKPDICGALEHTLVYEDSETRLKHLAVEAALLLKRKKQALNELVSPQIERKIAREVESRLNNAIEERKKVLESEIEKKKEEEKKEQEIFEQTLAERKKKIMEEIENEIKLEQEKEQEREREKEINQPTNTTTDMSQKKLVGNQFENRLNYRRASVSSRSASVKRTPSTPKSISNISPVVSKLELDSKENTIIIPKDQSNNDVIIMVNKAIQ